MKTKKILFIYTAYSSFVKTDYEILSSQFEVVKYHIKPPKGIGGIYELIKQFFYVIFKGWKYDAFFIWFADYHSFLPVLFAKILNKKSFVVIGGYDVARMPSLRYGVFVSKARGFCAIFSMKNSTLNLAVSKNVERKVRWIAKNSNTKLVYNCLNISENKNINPERENLVITVGIIDSERSYYLKGIDTFIEVARLLPEYSFMVIGTSKNLPEQIRNNRPDNMKFIKKVNHEELETYYKKAKIYCQFSRSESFGISIVEAMNFGCVPFVTNVGGMPELVGDIGLIVNREPLKIAEKINNHFFKTEMQESNRDRIMSIFLIQHRNEVILSLFQELF